MTVQKPKNEESGKKERKRPIRRLKEKNGMMNGQKVKTDVDKRNWNEKEERDKGIKE